MGKRIKRLLSFRLLNVRAPFVSQIFVWFNALLLLGIGGLFIVLVLAISEEPEIRYEGGAGQDSYAHAEEWMSHIRDWTVTDSKLILEGWLSRQV